MILFFNNQNANEETHQLSEVSLEYFEVQNSDVPSTSNEENPDLATDNLERTHETCEASKHLRDEQSNNLVSSSKQEDADLPTGRIEILILEIAISAHYLCTGRFANQIFLGQAA